MDINLKLVPREEREGYYTHPMIKRIWAVQMDILKEIDAVCRQHQIHYYGWFGTLLGAVRHHGFIPWDDDMDLAMLREDYERFRYYAKTELPERWKLREHEPSLICILNSDIIRLDQEFLEQSHGCPFITGVDIFCLDRIPQNEAEKQLQLNLFETVRILCVNWDLAETDDRWKDKSKWEYLEEIEALSGYHFDRQSPIKEQLYFLGDRIAAMYWDSESDDVTSLYWICEHQHYRIPRSYFNRVIEVPFENTTIPILEDYDLICRLTYGDNYMIPIKELKHDYLKKQIKHLRKYFEIQGEALPEIFNITFE